ncbi:MAG: PorV/PorQ family protein [Spirochaetes bacterium]|nr:PorV/PorQ family protein [Spirochaetota bacterium]
MNKKAVILIYYLLFLSMLLFSEPVALEIFSLNPSAREKALGEAAVVLVDSPTTLFYNPAGLGTIKDFGAALGYVNLFELYYSHLSLCYPLKQGTAGLGLHYITTGDFNEISYGLETREKISYSSAIVQAGYGVKFLDQYYGGISLKYLNSDIAGSVAKNLSFDLAFLTGMEMFKYYERAQENFKVGLALRNLGTGVKYIKEEEVIPTCLACGLFYKPIELFSVMYELDYFTRLESGPMVNKVGLEFLSEYFITPRIGLKGSSRGTHISLGTGLKMRLGLYRMAFDMTYEPHSDLGPALFFTLSMLKGAPEIFRREAILYETIPDLFREMKKDAVSFPREAVPIRIVDKSSAPMKTVFSDLVDLLHAELSREKQVRFDFTPLGILTIWIEKKKQYYQLKAILYNQSDNIRVKKYNIKFKTKKSIPGIVKKLSARIMESINDSFYSDLSILSVPKNATVTIDEKKAGNTPLYLHSILIGQHPLKITGQSRSITKVINVTANRENKYHFKLADNITPEKFNIQIVSGTVEKNKRAEEYSQIFEILFKEKSSYFTNYIVYNESPAHIAIDYRVIKKDDLVLEVLINDLLKKKSIKRLKSVITSDSEIPSICDQVISSVINHVIEEKKRSLPLLSNKGFLTGNSIPEGMEFFLASGEDRITLHAPFSIGIDAGEYRLDVSRKGEKVFSDWIIIEDNTTNYLNVLDDFTDDFQRLDPSFWDKEYFNPSHPDLSIRKGVKDGGLYLLSRISGKEHQRFKNGMWLGLVSHSFLSMPFEMKVQFKAKAFKGSRLYFGFMDNKNKKMFIRYDTGGYFCFQLGPQDNEIEARYITVFGDEDRDYHTLKVTYDGNVTGFYVDDIRIDELPYKGSEQFKFCLLGKATGKMSFLIKEFSIKRYSSAL